MSSQYRWEILTLLQYLFKSYRYDFLNVDGWVSDDLGLQWRIKYSHLNVLDGKPTYKYYKLGGCKGNPSCRYQQVIRSMVQVHMAD